MKLIFCMQINTKVSYKVILSLLMGMIKHSQSTQSKKFSISLQYLKIKSYEWSSFFVCRLTSKFLQVGNMLRKQSRNFFCVLLRYKTFRYFTGVHARSLLFVLFNSELDRSKNSYKSSLSYCN